MNNQKTNLGIEVRRSNSEAFAKQIVVNISEADFRRLGKYEILMRECYRIYEDNWRKEDERREN